MFDITPVGDWAAAVNESEQKLIVTEENGIRTVTEITEVDDVRYKVINKYKVQELKVPREVAIRKRWMKFGECIQDTAGPQLSTTYVAEDVAMQFTRNRAGEQLLEDSQIKIKTPGMGVGVMNCRTCKSKDHWTMNCPYKEQLGTEDPAKDGIETDVDGVKRYVAPGAGGGTDSRHDDFAVRITNLPLDYSVDELEGRLRDMFDTCGRSSRAHVPRGRNGDPRGFAFVNYPVLEYAERAVEMFHGYKFDYVVLHVELAKESKNR